MSSGPDPVERQVRPATLATVEEVVRAQMSHALGGRRGIAEAAVPTLLFTVLWLTTHRLELALGVGLAAAVAALVARLVQRSTTQFAIDALVGIGIGWLFVWLSARGGGDENDQALAYFLPGIIWSGLYTILIGGSNLLRWPFVGLLIGSVTGDLTSWRENRQILRLCTRLTWLFVLPGAVGVALQGPVWLAGHSGTMDADRAVALLAALRLGLGWPLRIAAFTAMVWLLARNRTPLEHPGADDPEHAEAPRTVEPDLPEREVPEPGQESGS